MDTILNVASLDDCWSFPPGWHFKALHGKQRGTFQVRIDQQYRIRFRWDDQHGAIDITAGDFHDEDS
jgi:proteic killer suppression protein